MSKYIGKMLSRRHGIRFDHTPTEKGIHGSVDLYPIVADYGSILDCVYEMSDMIASSNGVSIDQAIEQVLTDEKWTILPSHKKLIATMLE